MRHLYRLLAGLVVAGSLGAVGHAAPVAVGIDIVTPETGDTLRTGYADGYFTGQIGNTYTVTITITDAYGNEWYVGNAGTINYMTGYWAGDIAVLLAPGVYWIQTDMYENGVKKRTASTWFEVE